MRKQHWLSTGIIIAILAGNIPVKSQDTRYIHRPEGPMKTWSQEEFNQYINAMETARGRLAKTMDHSDRKFGLHDGNKIRTLYYNYGSIGRPNTEPSLEWPAYSNHGYAYEFGPIVGAEVVDADGDTVTIFSDGMLDGGDFDPSGGANWWGWEPLAGYAAAGQEFIARSDRTETWGANFPVDEDGEYQWPGQYGDGIITADLESYYIMDDKFNAEFQYYPNPSDSSIRGLGVQVTVRGYQYAASVAEDIIFFQYKVKNVSEKRLDKVVIGMIGDPHIGGAGDFSDDYAGFINNDGLDSYSGETQNVSSMVYCWDKQGSGNDYNIPWEDLGWLGYKFLESPGLANDGIDNDNDGRTDESQYDGVDNDGDWQVSDAQAVADTAEARDWWDPIMWNGIDDDGDGRIDDWGDLDGKSDDLNGNGQPDPGEPDYEYLDIDESDMIGLTSFWAPIYGTDEASMDDRMWQRMEPGTFATVDDIEQEADNIFLFGTGYFSLDPGESQKFSVAVIMGQGKDDLINNGQVAEWIYKLGFQFTKPPDKPNLVAVPGNNKVTLYWDETAEQSIDPVAGVDFEGYKIYRSNVKGQWGKIITDNQGIGIGYVPIAQYDLVDEFEGPHPIAAAEGYHMDMGDNTGLQRTFVDSNLVNGLTYYYAVTAYDQGSVEGKLVPLECAKNIGDVNVVEVIPNGPAAGYQPAEISVDHYQGFATATMQVQLLDHIRTQPDTVYDIMITAGGNNKYLTIGSVAAGDTSIIWDRLSFTTASSMWNNTIPFGPYQLYFMDLTQMKLDSAVWISGPETFSITVGTDTDPLARNMEIRFFSQDADTSVLVNPQPIKFQVWNIDEEEQMDVVFLDNDNNQELSIGDQVVPLVYQNGAPTGTWSLAFNTPSDSSLLGADPGGAVFAMYVSKPFASGGSVDRWRVSATSGYVDNLKMKQDLDRIAVVPNPYVAASGFETPPPQVFTYGRGERRVDFIHLPQTCTIRIYTMAGDHVRTIEHSGTVFDGTASWNLLSKDDHEIAPGIYIYHVEVPDGGEKIGRLAIIK